MPAKKKTRVNSQEEQTQLLRMILAELQTLNANMAASRPAIAEPSAQENPDSDDDEELEYFE